jgi:hypothetical protein
MIVVSLRNVHLQDYGKMSPKPSRIGLVTGTVYKRQLLFWSCTLYLHADKGKGVPSQDDVSPDRMFIADLIHYFRASRTIKQSEDPTLQNIKSVSAMTNKLNHDSQLRIKYRVWP